MTPLMEFKYLIYLPMTSCEAFITVRRILVVIFQTMDQLF